MHVRLDGKVYYLDNALLLDLMRKDLGAFCTPGTPQAEAKAAERLGAKAILNMPWVGPWLYGTLAKIFGVANWRDLKPARHTDSLQHTFNLVMNAAALILDNSTIEVERDEQSLSENGAEPELRITQTILQKSDGGVWQWSHGPSTANSTPTHAPAPAR